MIPKKKNNNNNNQGVFLELLVAAKNYKTIKNASLLKLVLMKSEIRNN